MSIILRPPQAIVYPESDGKPLAENTLQFRWIVTIKEGVDRVFHDRADVFVAGDLFWYPVEGHPEICQAPDVLIAFGRPKGERGSYMQWIEGGIAPQVLFEVLSPGNRKPQMDAKFRFFDKYGCLEYYIYDPDKVKLAGYENTDGRLKKIRKMHGWTSRRLGIRFDLSGSELTIDGPGNRRFLTFQEIAEQNDQLTRERDRVVQERDQLAQQLEIERQRMERMVAQMRGMGIEPPA